MRKRLARAPAYVYGVALMPRSQVFAPPFKEINRPACPKCGMPMWLAHVAPDKPGFDKRTFECPVCEHSEAVVVAYNLS